MEAEVKYTIRQHIALILRGYKMYNALNRTPAVLSIVLSSLAGAFVPFINLFFSALILNELVGSRDPGRLTELVLWTIFLNLAALLMQKGLERWVIYCNDRYWISIYKIHSDKMISLDFCDAENPDVRKQYDDINGHHNGMGFGFGRLRYGLDGIPGGFVRIALSSVLAFALFSTKVSNDSSLQ